MSRLAAAILLGLCVAFRAASAQDSSAIRNMVGTPPDSSALRSPPAPRPPRTSVLFAFTGDINLGTLTIRAAIPPDSGREIFSRVDTLLRGDLVIGNFEGVLADTGVTQKCAGGPLRIDSIAALPPLPDSVIHPKPPTHPTRKRARHGRPKPRMCYAFATPTWLAPRLVEAGFTHLNLANNHANDMGPGARSASDSILRGLNLRTYGPLGSISIDTVQRGDSATIVGLIGFTTYPFAYDLLDIERSRAVIDSIRPLVDLLVVTFHGGAEGDKAQHVPAEPEKLGKEERGDLRRWAHAVIDAGADLVVGHGPHVLRGIEFYRGHLVAYSLGNFATYRGFNLAGPA
ncbi:MAG: CapA family protein, partial [Gemmatimonadota bacterium]